MSEREDLQRLLRSGEATVTWRLQSNPERDRALTDSLHRLLDRLPMPVSPQYRMICYGYVRIDVRFLT